MSVSKLVDQWTQEVYDQYREHTGNDFYSKLSEIIVDEA